MTWLPPAVHDDPRVIDLLEHDDGPAAFGLWIFICSWAGGQPATENGAVAVPEGIARRFTPDGPVLLPLLTKCRLLTRDDDGYTITLPNPPAARAPESRVPAQLRAARSKAGRRGADARWRNPTSTSTIRPSNSNGTWTGAFPFPQGALVPAAGIPVVYLLWDRDDVLCYVGSSGNLRSRLTQHESDGKLFTRWEARPCSSRGAAYAEEDLLIGMLRPYLNKIGVPAELTEGNQS